MNEKIFAEGMKCLKAEVSPCQTERLCEYSRLLVEWNEKMNLTAVTDPDGIAVKHFLDSVLPIYNTKLKECGSVADVGTGAGFPGLPMAIMMPQSEFTLIDSLNKRVKFLNTVVEALGLNNVKCFHGRAEELGRNPDFRERFDAVVSRAVANMTVLSEYCLPYVKVGGIFVALKAENSEEELEAARPMIGTLGGTVEDVAHAPLPMSDITRDLIIVRKTKPTAEKFPRRADKIKKSAKK